MRLSGFVTFNTPILLISLFTKNQTPLFNAGCQWLNQTYNAGLNYGNRNATSTMSYSDLGKGYFSAVVVSCSIAIVSRMAFAKQLSTMKGGKLIVLNAALNFLCAACAGASNVSLMR